MAGFINSDKVKEVFLDELISRSPWSSAPGISDDSFLYKIDQERSPSPFDVPVSFGFTKISGVVQNAADTVGITMIGYIFLQGRRACRGTDLRLKLFGELSSAIHRRLERYVTDTIEGTVIYALETIVGRVLNINSTIPEITSELNKKRFFEIVSSDLSLAFPLRSSPIIASETNMRLAAAMGEGERVKDLRDILLEETIADGLKNKEFLHAI